MSRAVLFLVFLYSGPWAPCWAGGVHWLCGQSDDLTRIVCVADVDETVAVRAPAASTTVRGKRFPLDRRRAYAVEMWSPATEPAWVEQLARATICYRSPGCELTFSAPASMLNGYGFVSLR